MIDVLYIALDIECYLQAFTVNVAVTLAMATNLICYYGVRLKMKIDYVVS